MPLAVTFPLSGRFGDLHPLEYVRAGRTKNGPATRPDHRSVVPWELLSEVALVQSQEAGAGRLPPPAAKAPNQALKAVIVL